MTFSDAEEDQPSGMQNGRATPNGVIPSRPIPSEEGRPPLNESPAAGASSCPLTNNDISRADISTSSSNVPKQTPPPCISPSNSSPSPSSTASGSTVSTISSRSVVTSVPPPLSLEDGAAGVSPPPGQPPLMEGEASGESSSSSMPSSLQLNAEAVVERVGTGVKGLETEKVKEKLNQIHNYINQTSAAMEALEQEGNLTKIGQYNTLVKCMRDLKKSEGKLTSHLTKVREKASSQSRMSGGGSEQPAVPQRESGSESLGVVRSLGDEGGGGGAGHVTSTNRAMLESLARHEGEQGHLSERLRDSLVRREELMTRYQATRERLSTLKRQRLGFVHEERRLLQSVGAPPNPYDDPIPG